MKNLSISSSEIVDLKKFTLKVSIFLAPIIICIVLLFWGLAQFNSLPAPVLTSRVSLDEKFRYARLHPVDKLDVLASGSSMTLYNFSTEPLFKFVKPETNYVNFSSWGVKISDTATLVRFLVARYQPDTIIIVTSPFDFYVNTNPLTLHEADYNRYLDGFFAPYFYVKYQNPSFLLRATEIREQRSKTDIYLSLRFDQGGGVSISPPSHSIDPNLWTAQFLPKQLDQANYDALESLLQELNSQNIQVIIAQSPMRANFFAQDNALNQAETHWNTIASITKAHDAHFFNMHTELKLDDSFFVDWGHLNERGAKTFTMALLQQIEAGGLLSNGEFMSVEP